MLIVQHHSNNQREELEISQIVAESLGLDPENQSNTMQFFEQIQILDINYLDDYNILYYYIFIIIIIIIMTYKQLIVL